MNRTPRIATTLVLGLTALTVLTACGSETATQPDPATVVTRVSINAPRTSLAIGSTVQLSADAANAAGTILAGTAIAWISSRPDVATVTSLGLVKAVATGTTTVTASTGSHSGTVAITVVSPNQISLISDAGDYIGLGTAYTYTNATAVVRVSASASAVQVSIDGKEHWNGTFQVAKGARLEKGSYTNATRWPFSDDGAGLSWYGEGRGCNTLTGSFTVDSLSWANGTGSSLTAIDMTFEQHCECGIAALRGTIHWRADDPTVPPGPAAIPTNLWQPPPGAAPATGNVVYLQSQPGDYIGLGATNLYQSNVIVSGSGVHVSVSAGGYSGDFMGMNTIAELGVGYYGDLQRFPFNNPVQGGLDWYGNGRGCNTLKGWFVVDRVSFVNGALTGIELRFEQHCEGQSAALNGYVRWGQLSS